MKEVIQQSEKTRIVAVSDPEPFDDSYIDTWVDHTDEEKQHEREILWESIETHGVWGLVKEEKCSKCGHWEDVDSVWGIVPDDKYTLESTAFDYWTID